MSANTNIQWADSTFNPWIGCTKVGPGCDNCYAERIADKRLHRATWGSGQWRTLTSPDNWRGPEKWNWRLFVECSSCGWRGDSLLNAPGGGCPNCMSWDIRPQRRRVFCASLADVFDNEVPIEWLADLLELVRTTPHLDWLLLTKRAGNVKDRLVRVREYVGTYWRGDAQIELHRWVTQWLNGTPPANVWLGATICNQQEAERDIPKLLATQAMVKFLSIEPLLGPIDFAGMWVEYTNPAIHQNVLEALDWVIVGGESGPGARPMHPDWVRSLRDQCNDVGTPFLFKQWGEWVPRGPQCWGYPTVNGVLRIRLTDAGEDGQALGARGGSDCWMQRAGKKVAGRQLDGREWSEFPICIDPSSHD